MTATMEKNGRITLPPEVCMAAALDEGETVEVMVSTNGEVRLVRPRRHQLGLLEHLRGMEGLEPIRDRETVGPPLSL